MTEPAAVIDTATAALSGSPDIVADVANSPAADHERKFAQMMVDAGHWSRAQADEAVANSLARMAGKNPKGQHQSGSPSESALEGAPVLETGKPADPFGDAKIDPAFDRPESPREYRFEPLRHDPLNLEQLAEVQEMFHAARFPAGIAGQIFDTIGRLSGQRLTDNEIAIMGQQSTANLQRIFGPDYDAKITLAQKYVNELARQNPRIIDILEATGAGNDETVIRQVVLQAERVMAGRKK